jgi:lipopolysaccharide/colanic/teichoic acid biosynthesis glycosyltransferase/glycosyltransferase involved in cell wall biosynthesis
MKVVVIASLAYSLVNFRGALLRRMADQGYEVIACAPDSDAAVIDALTAMGVRFRAIPMDRTGTNPWRDLATLLSLRSLLRRERPDVVLAYTQKPIVYGGLAARLSARRISFYAMVTGLGHAFGEPVNAKRALVRAILSRLYRIAIARARCVFVFNDGDTVEMRQRHILQKHHRVVQLPGSGIDLVSFSPQPLPDGPQVFLLVARMLREKGIIEFIEAARLIRKEHPSARFQLLGPLDSNPSGLTRDQLDQRLTGSGVEYLGEARDVRAFFAASTVFVLPTYYREGLPRTIIEAMAIGRAIVTTDTPGCRETVIEGFNGFLVPPRNAVALAQTLVRFAEDASLAAAMGQRSRTLAQQWFDVHRVNDILLDVMFPGEHEEVVAPRRASRALTDRPALELSLALLLGIFLLPLALLTLLAVALLVGAPVLFVQIRAGRGGRLFPLVKFRTMHNRRDANGALLPGTEWLTRGGRIIRRMRVDELPEVCNILRGEMGLIGPRPLLPETVAAMGEAGRLRGAIKPGLTGWAQVNGNALLSETEKLALDLWYIGNRSLRLDFRILWRTLLMVIGGEKVNRAQIGRAYAGTADRRG